MTANVAGPPRCRYPKLRQVKGYVGLVMTALALSAPHTELGLKLVAVRLTVPRGVEARLQKAQS